MGGQIQIQNSRNSLVKNNIVHTSYCTSNAIVIIQQNRTCRGCPNPKEMIVINNVIENNKIIMDDCTVPRLGAVGDFHFNAFQNNSFSNNTYILFKNNRSVHHYLEWFWLGLGGGPSKKEKKQLRGNTLSSFQKKAKQGYGSIVIDQPGNQCL